jgi:hypothetical protein
VGRPSLTPVVVGEGDPHDLSSASPRFVVRTEVSSRFPALAAAVARWSRSRCAADRPLGPAACRRVFPARRPRQRGRDRARKAQAVIGNGTTQVPAPERNSVSKIKNFVQVQRDISNAAWNHVGRSTVGFVRTRNSAPSSLGSGTLIRFGDTAGVLTCAHVLEALLKEDDIGILCFPIRATQIQTLRLPMAMTNSIAIGSAPWGESGPDLAFLRLPAANVGDIERVATIANGDFHRQNIVAGEPAPTRKVCAVSGVIDEMTKPPVIRQIVGGIVATTPFEGMINIGHVFVDDESADRFRFQPGPSEGMILPKSYKGTSGGGLWKFFLDENDFSVVQVRLIGVAYWQKPVGDELHIIGHGQASIYETLFNAIRQKWPS